MFLTKMEQLYHSEKQSFFFKLYFNGVMSNQSSPFISSERKGITRKFKNIFKKQFCRKSFEFSSWKIEKKTFFEDVITK